MCSTEIRFRSYDSLRFIVSLLLLTLCDFKSVPKLNIALHAQVYPTNDKIVGSVITTDGLKAAFEKREEVEHVEIFYPFHYGTLFKRVWDFIIIEGWFPMINEFIELSRNHNPDVIIIFYCLDPTFPAIAVTASLDVDGFMSNSRIITSHLRQYAPSIYVMLAADEEKMKPVPAVRRDYGAVYVGAGGGMISYKSALLLMLESAIPLGLRLHGSHWNEVPTLKHLWQGALPRENIPEAYASAEVVLATTLDSQIEYGMINNRIFEGLACGAIVISDYSSEIELHFKDAVIIVDKPESAGALINHIMNEPEHADTLRKRARKTILERHTWSHRVVDIFRFYSEILYKKGTIRKPLRLNSPKLAWVVSDHLLHHSDYHYSIKSNMISFSELYDIDSVSEEKWLNNYSNVTWTSQFDVIIAVVTLFDTVDLTFQILPVLEVSNRRKLQRRGCFMLGFKDDIMPPHKGVDVKLLHYEVIWFRSWFERQTLEKKGIAFPGIRWQHAFGVTNHKFVHSKRLATLGQLFEHRPATVEKNVDETEIEAPEYHPLDYRYKLKLVKKVVICFYEQIDYCSYENRTSASGMLSSLILIGGSLELWLLDPKFLGDTSLSTMLLSAEEPSSMILAMIESSEEIYIMHQGSGLLNADVLWPLVYAASLQIKINLFLSNSHLESLGTTDCASWNDQYRDSSIKVGIARMLGLGLSRSHVEVKGPLSISTSTVIPLELTHTYFEEGRDGQCCVVYNGKDLVCIIRALVPVFLLVTKENWDMEEAVKESFEIDVELRGNMFMDVIFKVTHQISVDISKESFETSDFDLRLATAKHVSGAAVLPIILR